jgi:KaiC/GvpD/RAD55 family RecA-like ATPase
LGTTDPYVGEYWFKAGSTVKISATAPGATSGERYFWLGWTGTGSNGYSGLDNSTFITMNGPINETAAWRHEYSLTVTSPYGSPTPATEYCEAGMFINASVTSPVAGSIGSRYACIGWIGTGSVSTNGTTTFVTFTINTSSSITWRWKTQYLLTALTNPTNLSPQPNLSPPGPWYDNATLVNCTAQKIDEKAFDHWTVGETNWDRGVNPITIIMDGPYNATAHYVNAPVWWDALFRPEIQAIVGLALGVLSVVLVAKRKSIVKTLAKPPSIELSKVVLPGRITSGYSDLDNLLLGGIPENYAVILTSPSCDERDLLVKRFLEAGAKNNEVTFYVTIDPGEVRPLAEEFQSNCYLFICNPRADTMIKNLPNTFKLKGVENLTEINIALNKAFNTLDMPSSGPKRACIEIISDVLLQHHAVQTRRWLTDLITEMKSRGFTTLAVMNPKMHPSEEFNAILDLFDGEINIYEKEIQKGPDKFLKIKKMTNQKYLRDELFLNKERLEP